MGHSMASQRSEISKAMSDFKEELKELITKGMEEAIEKAMEAMRQSLADWDIERKSTADHLNVQAEDNQFPTQQQYDVPQKSYGDRHNDQHKYYVPQKSYAGDRVVPFQNGQMKLHQFQPQQEQPLPNQNQTYSVVSKSLTQMPARQVFEAKSERIFVQKASLSISKGTNPLIWPPNPCRNALNTHCNMVMVYKLHENEYGKLDSKIKNRTPKTHVVGRSLSPGIAPVSSRNALVEDQIGRNSLNHSSSMIELADVAASLSGLSLSKHDLGPLQTQLAHRLDKQSGKQPNLSNDSNGYGQSFPQSNEVSRTEKIALATNYVDLLKVKGLVADLNVVKLGLNGQANVPRRTSSYLLGPFLLLHLGGPDTITAFTTEDNELWLRHLFYLVSKCVAVAYAYYQFLQTNFMLRIPMLLMFLWGIIKCAERTCARYYGSANSFRNFVLAKLDWEANVIPNKGIMCFDLYVFLAVSCENAFRLVEVELNYLYDVLFTKLSVLHHKIGYIFRTLSLFAVVDSFALYRSHHQKHHSHNDIVITYTLLIEAIGLEVIAFYMLMFTDWTVIKLKPLSDDATLNYKSWKAESETKVVNIQLREYREHSGSLTGKSFDQRGMVLPFQPLSMSFSNISYHADVPLELKQQGVIEDRLRLLVDITGAFRLGVLTALVGVSGAGKTTIMDVLAGRKTGGVIEGSIKIAGYPKNQETFARISGYCEQNDIHLPCLAVHESFDELVFMKRGGELIYAGPLSPRSYKLVEYSEAIQGVPKIRPDQNLATWMLVLKGDSDDISMVRAAFLDERGITFDLEDKVVLWEQGIVMDWPKSQASPMRGQRGIRTWRIKEGKNERMRISRILLAKVS